MNLNYPNNLSSNLNVNANMNVVNVTSNVTSPVTSPVTSTGSTSSLNAAAFSLDNFESFSNRSPVISPHPSTVTPLPSQGYQLQPPPPSQSSQPQVPHPRFCRLNGDEPLRSVAGVEKKFLVETFDAHSQRCSHGNAEVTVLLHGPTFLEAAVIDRGDGSYEVSYTPTKKGFYDMFVGLHGVQIAASPFGVVVDANVTHASSSVAAGEALSHVTVGKAASLCLQSRDIYGNPRDEGGDRFSVTLEVFTLLTLFTVLIFTTSF